MQDVFDLKESGLVLQGGGARGAFTAGVLDVLMERNVYFPYLIGTSAGALNGVNYLSRDIGRSKIVTTELLGDKRFVSVTNFFRRGTFFDFAYLFHNVPKTRLPFNAAAYNGSPIEFIAAATGMDGKPYYFRKCVCKEFYKALAASASLPLISKVVDVEGTPCLDGGVVAGVPFRKALEDGRDKLVIIETRARGYRKKPTGWAKMLLAKLMYGKYREFIKLYRRQAELYNADADEIERLEDEGKVFVIRPDVPPVVKRAERDKDKLLALYEEGRGVMAREFDKMLAYLGLDHE